MMKEKFHPVVQDKDKRLIALESRPVKPTLSNVSFAEEPNPTTMTTLIERIQVLESKENNLEPSLSTLHGAKALSSKMTPRGALRAVSEVSAQIGKFSFFWSFEASKTKFRSNFADGTRSRLSFSFSEMSLI